MVPKRQNTYQNPRFYVYCILILQLFYLFYFFHIISYVPSLSLDWKSIELRVQLAFRISQTLANIQNVGKGLQKYAALFSIRFLSCLVFMRLAPSNIYTCHIVDNGGDGAHLLSFAQVPEASTSPAPSPSHKVQPPPASHRALHHTYTFLSKQNTYSSRFGFVGMCFSCV